MVLLHYQLIALSLVAIATAIRLPQQRFVVTDYGAVADGKTLNTGAFERAVAAAAAAAQGGLVVVPAGRFLSGSFSLANNVYLHLDARSTLLASPNAADYDLNKDWAFLLTENVQHTGVVGDGGEIDGQAVPVWTTGYNATVDKFEVRKWTANNCTGECRPRLVRFNGCRDVVLANVTIGNSPDWTNHLFNCTDVLVERVNVWGDHRWPNNDGIDLDNVVNAIVRHSSFSVGDDAICLKSDDAKGICSRIHVHDCDLSSKSSAIKFGSATLGNMTHMLFERIRITNSNRGLGIQQRDQGDIFNITYRDVQIETQFKAPTWWGNAEPIWVTSAPREPTAPLGKMYDIRFENIEAHSENGVFVGSRAADSPIRNVHFERVHITVNQTTDTYHPYHDWSPSYPPDHTPAQVDGFFFDTVDGATLHDSSVVFTEPRRSFWGPCFSQSRSSNIDHSSLKCVNGPSS